MEIPETFAPTEEEILLHLLLIGDSLPVDIAEAYGRHPSSIQRSLATLLDLGLVARRPRAKYTLTVDGWREARRVLAQRENCRG